LKEPGGVKLSFQAKHEKNNIHSLLSLPLQQLSGPLQVRAEVSSSKVSANHRDECWPTHVKAHQILTVTICTLGKVSVEYHSHSTLTQGRHRSPQIKAWNLAKCVHMRSQHTSCVRIWCTFPHAVCEESHKGVPLEEVGGVQLSLQASQLLQVLGPAHLNLEVLICVLSTLPANWRLLSSAKAAFSA